MLVLMSICAVYAAKSFRGLWNWEKKQTHKKACLITIEVS